MRLRATASTGLVALAAIATTWGLACSHDLDPFTKGSGEADTAIDTGSLADADDVGTDVELDSTVPDGDAAEDTNDAIVDAPDTSVCKVTVVDADVPETDTGPEAPVSSCTSVGPPNTVCVAAAASFNLGTNRAACVDGGASTESPEVTVKTSAFFIDEHEVTVGRFRTWWNSTTRTWPNNGTTIFTGGSSVKWKGTGAGSWPSAPREPATSSGCTWLGPTDATNDDKPLNCVDWFTALGFCMSTGERLPTEAEWELVASAGEDRLFPWSPAGTEEASTSGATVDCAHALQGSCPPLATAADSTVWGRSKWGVWNMAGSLAEWTLDEYIPGYSFAPGSTDPVKDPNGGTLRSVRGGGHNVTDPALWRAAARASAVATDRDTQIGFRCAKR